MNLQRLRLSVKEWSSDETGSYLQGSGYQQRVLTCQEIEKVMCGCERGPVTRWNVHIDQDAQNFHKQIAVYVGYLHARSALRLNLALN